MLEALCIAIAVQGAPSAEDVAPTDPPPPQAVDLLDRFIQAAGGAAAIHAVKSLEVTGRIHLPGGREGGHFLWLVADGGRACFQTSFPGLGSAAFGSDGERGWSLLELPSNRTVETLTMEVVEARRRRANWFELAFTLPERAVSMTTVGPVQFEGDGAWEIDLERADGRRERLFIDRETSLLLGFTMPLDLSPGAPTITVHFDDWRPVKDLTLFHRVEISGGRTRVGLDVRSVSIDGVALDDPRFGPPTEQVSDDG